MLIPPFFEYNDWLVTYIISKNGVIIKKTGVKNPVKSMVVAFRNRLVYRVEGVRSSTWGTGCFSFDEF